MPGGLAALFSVPARIRRSPGKPFTPGRLSGGNPYCPARPAQAAGLPGELTPTFLFTSLSEEAPLMKLPPPMRRRTPLKFLIFF